MKSTIDCTTVAKAHEHDEQLEEEEEEEDDEEEKEEGEEEVGEEEEIKDDYIMQKLEIDSVRSLSASSKQSQSMLEVDEDAGKGSDLVKKASIYSLDAPSTFPVGITADHRLSDDDVPTEIPSRCSLDTAADPMDANGL